MWSALPPALKILVSPTIFANIGTQMFRPFMPLTILLLGGGVVQIGMFSNVNTMSAAFLQPLGGRFSDAVGSLQAVGIGTVFGWLDSSITLIENHPENLSARKEYVKIRQRPNISRDR